MRLWLQSDAHACLDNNTLCAVCLVRDEEQPESGRWHRMKETAVSATYVVEITCDAPSCGKQHIEEGTAAWVRVLAADQGWTRASRRDYCPAHTPKVLSSKDR